MLHCVFQGSGTPSDSIARNSHQAILITDGLKSYAVFSYQCGLLQWGRAETYSGSPYSTIGYNIGGTNTNSLQFSAFQNHPLSGFSEVSTIACVNNANGIDSSNLVYLVGESQGNATRT